MRYIARMRRLLPLLLLLTACAAPEVVAPAPPAATDALPACDGTTPLVPGVPGSPGHLLPSPVNPNGASELAHLMRTMVADWKQTRDALAAGTPVPPRFPTHRKIRCSWPTAPQDRREPFDALATAYAASVQAFDAAPTRASYDGVLAACTACHSVSCPGPIEVIEGLR